jgi:hypothetical protein
LTARRTCAFRRGRAWSCEHRMVEMGETREPAGDGFETLCAEGDTAVPLLQQMRDAARIASAGGVPAQAAEKRDETVSNPAGRHYGDKASIAEGVVCAEVADSP